MCVAIEDSGDYSLAQVFSWALGTSFDGGCQKLVNLLIKRI
jgi:hypothetical protein